MAKRAKLLPYDHPDAGCRWRKKEKQTAKQKKLYKAMAKGRAALIGALGGKKTSKRGSAYFRRIAAKRKKFGGGRPKKK